MIDRDNRTFICSVVYYDIVDYSTKSVEVQIRLKDQLNQFTTEAIKNVAVNDRIILDTGDGTVICFLGDPEDALFVAMSLRDAVSSAACQNTEDPMLVRFGINLGPVKLVNDINNQKNIIGDGINVGQRVMGFAEPGQILVSRSYYEVVSCLTQEYAKLFNYIGMRADKHIRKHEIYSIVRTTEQEKAVPTTESPQRGETQIPARKENSVSERPVFPADSPPDQELKDKNDTMGTSSIPVKHLGEKPTMRFVYGGAAAAIILVAILFFVMQRNFGNGEIHPDKTALTPGTQVKNPDKTSPEGTRYAMNVKPEQTESITPIPPESTSHQESTQPSGNASQEQTATTKTGTPVPDMAAPEETPGESLPEHTQSKEAAGSEQTTQPAPTHPASNAVIQLAISPWGEVYVDGKRKGTSPPLTSVAVAPGKHRIEIKNTSLPPYSQIREIKPNEKLKIRHTFK